MSATNPVGARDIELGRLRNPQVGINTSTSLLNNESTTSLGSRCTRLIKKIDGISAVFGVIGGILGSGIGVALSYAVQGKGSFEFSIASGSLAGFFSGVIKCTLEHFTFLELSREQSLELSREQSRKKIISSIAIATIAGFIISLPMGFFFTKEAEGF